VAVAAGSPTRPRQVVRPGPVTALYYHCMSPAANDALHAVDVILERPHGQGPIPGPSLRMTIPAGRRGSARAHERAGQYRSTDGCIWLQFAATFAMQLALVTLGVQGAAMSTILRPPCRCWRTPGSLTTRPEVCVQGTAGSECRSMAGPSG
jgi:hypothetical protein